MAEVSQAPESEASSQANAPKDNRPLYEVGFHLVPTLDEAKVSAAVEAIRAELTKANAEIVGEQFPQKMTLSYVIERAASGKREKYAESYFGWIKFAVETREYITTLENMLQNSREILRFLLIKTERDEPVAPRRAVFSSNRLEGETIKKPASQPEEGGAVSEEELDKSIDALVN